MGQSLFLDTTCKLFDDSCFTCWFIYLSSSVKLKTSARTLPLEFHLFLILQGCCECQRISTSFWKCWRTGCVLVVGDAVVFLCFCASVFVLVLLCKMEKNDGQECCRRGCREVLEKSLVCLMSSKHLIDQIVFLALGYPASRFSQILLKERY